MADIKRACFQNDEHWHIYDPFENVSLCGADSPIKTGVHRSTWAMLESKPQPICKPCKKENK